MAEPLLVPAGAEDVDEPIPARLTGARLVLPWVGMLLLLCVTVGALTALFWANTVVLPTWLVNSDGSASMTQAGWTSVAGGDVIFICCGLLIGPGIGYVAWRWFETLGWPVAVIAACASLLSGVVCWQLGAVMGPGPFPERIVAASPGDLVPIALELHALSALVVWPLGAVVCVLIASAVARDPETEDEEQEAATPDPPTLTIPRVLADEPAPASPERADDRRRRGRKHQRGQQVAHRDTLDSGQPHAKAE